MPDSKMQFQHYISQFLLRNFEDSTFAPRRKIWRYDLKTNICEPKTIKNLAGIRNAWDSDFEKAFSGLETKACEIINKLIKIKRSEKNYERRNLELSVYEHKLLLRYLIWLIELNPERAKFILNNLNLKKDWESWLYDSKKLSEKQEQEKNYHREQYEETGKIPDIALLSAQQNARFDIISNKFGKTYFICTPESNPFILSDYYITPIIASNYDEADNPWEVVSHIYFPLAYDICLVWNNKTLSDAEIEQNFKEISIENINSTAVCFAQEISRNKYIYGMNESSLKKAVENFSQKGYLMWK